QSTHRQNDHAMALYAGWCQIRVAPWVSGSSVTWPDRPAPDSGFNRTRFADVLGALAQITDEAFAEYGTTPGGDRRPAATVLTVARQVVERPTIDPVVRWPLTQQHRTDQRKRLQYDRVAEYDGALIGC